jgi:uncharacterized protein YgiM (DUF1202 family)
MRAFILFCLVVLTAPATAQAQSEPRLALVIGNAAYPSQSLRNPVNDAKAMAASLRRLGFEVIERTNAGKKAMEDAALAFGEKLKAGGVGLFYYAGHGVQTRGHNYLVPVDAAITSEASVRVQAFDVGLVLDLMNDARNRANVVILDACRNNPFRGVMRGASPGLAAIDAARGTLIAYSTAPGAVSADGDDANSPYTAALVKQLAEPGMKAEEMFKRVRGRVVEVTKGAQTPWESSSLTGDLILNLNITVTPPASAATTGGASSRDAVDVAFWQSIANSKDPQDYRDYLAQFPNGTFAALARRRAGSLAGQQPQQQAALPPPAKAEPADKPALEPLDKALVATQNARMREAPSLSGKQIASLAAGQAVKALGKVKDQNWLLVERPDGTTGYVSGALLEDAASWRARAEEAQRKAEEAEKQRQQQAAAPAPAPQPAPPPSPYAAVPPAPTSPAPTSPAPSVRQPAYERIMGILLSQVVGSGPDKGKTNPYRKLPKPKALAACVDWSAGTVEGLAVGAWADSYIPPGRSGNPVRPDAVARCERFNDTPGRCRCQAIDEDDQNVLEVPASFAAKLGSASATGFNGRWRGRAAEWDADLNVRGTAVAGVVRGSASLGLLSVSGTVDQRGTLSGSASGQGTGLFALAGQWPNLLIRRNTGESVAIPLRRE